MQQSLALILCIYFTGTAASHFYLYQSTAYTGVVDRIEEDQAVILIEELKGELLVSVEKSNLLLEPDQWLLIYMTNRGFQVIGPLDEMKQEHMNEMRTMMEKLRAKKPSLD